MAGSWTRVLVGVDGSDGSVRALRWAAAEAEARGAELCAVATYMEPPSSGDLGYKIAWVDQTDWRGETDAKLQQTLLKALGEDPDVSVQSRVIDGPAAKTLIDLSEQADLLVVGTRGHGGFAGMLLGSVSQHLAAHAHCAVVVVR